MIFALRALLCFRDSRELPVAQGDKVAGEGVVPEEAADNEPPAVVMSLASLAREPLSVVVMESSPAP